MIPDDTLRLKTHRLVAGCRTREQALVADRWLTLAFKRDSQLAQFEEYYRSQLARLLAPAVFR